MLHIILLEAAIELVPSELTSLKEIQKHAYKRNKRPNEILLDQSNHGRSMTRLEDGDRRGRPDIVLFSLQSLLETPLCKAGLLSMHIQLQDGRIVEVNPAVRLPRNHDRFVGLMEQLLLRGQVPPTGDPLLRMINGSLSELVSSLRGNSLDAMTLLAVEGGQKIDMHTLVEMYPSKSDVPVILGVGAFPHGDFLGNARDVFETHIELDHDVMMAWHVCSEVLWTYSLKHEIIANRYSEA